MHPIALRTKVLKLLHQGYPGIRRMKSFALNYTYWPGMDHDIEEMYHLCRPCAGAAAKQPLKATLKSWLPATKPREHIHIIIIIIIDVAGTHLGRHFLTIVYAQSKYPVLFQCPARRPIRHWKYFVNSAPKMVFQRQLSATKDAVYHTRV
jgi:hypothetical protein